MDVEHIRVLRLADPFKPFALVTKAGESLPVEHPRWLSIAPNGKRVAYAPRMGGVRFISLEDLVDARVDETLSTPWRRAQ